VSLEITRTGKLHFSLNSS